MMISNALEKLSTLAHLRALVKELLAGRAVAHVEVAHAAVHRRHRLDREKIVVVGRQLVLQRKEGLGFSG